MQVAPLRAVPSQAASFEEQQQGQLSEFNQTAIVPPTGIERSSDNGRKYGQRHVKGSEYPWSYYKCTHPSCPTKKKIERSLDGHVTEIVYKGVHNHNKPQPSCQMGAAAAAAAPHEEGESTEGCGSLVKVEAGLSWENTKLGLMKVNNASRYSQQGKSEGLESSLSASVVTDLSDSLSTPPQRQNSNHLESLGTPEQSSISASEDDDGRTQVDKFSGEDFDEEESDSNRRKKETDTMDIIGATRVELFGSLIAVQTTTDIDILDDGYRWHKYMDRK